MTVMDFYAIPDSSIEAELGKRIKALRLRRNITQQMLADATALSLNTIKALEAGRGKLASLIPVLRELRALEHLDSFIPAPTVSPIQLAKLQGKKRQRASGERHKAPPKDDAEW